MWPTAHSSRRMSGHISTTRRIVAARPVIISGALPLDREALAMLAQVARRGPSLLSQPSTPNSGTSGPRLKTLSIPTRSCPRSSLAVFPWTHLEGRCRRAWKWRYLPRVSSGGEQPRRETPGDRRSMVPHDLTYGSKTVAIWVCQITAMTSGRRPSTLAAAGKVAPSIQASGYHPKSASTKEPDLTVE